MRPGIADRYLAYQAVCLADFDLTFEPSTAKSSIADLRMSARPLLRMLMNREIVSAGQITSSSASIISSLSASCE